MFVWKFAQCGHVNDEKTFTVTLAFESPMLNILLSALTKKIQNIINDNFNSLFISIIECL